MTALLLLAPATPMLFQGQEFGSTRPFVYFADHDAELARAGRQGAARVPGPVPVAGRPGGQRPHPRSRRAARPSLSCKLDWSETRRGTPAIWRCTAISCACGARTRRSRRSDLSGRRRRVLGAEALLLRYLVRRRDDRLLLVNLGIDLHLDVAPEPLLAPPLGARWRTLWSSEDPRYGGRGAAAVETDDGFHLPGHAAVVLVSGGGA